MPDVEIEATCPVCENKFKKMASELTYGTEVKCPKCGESTKITTNVFEEMLKEDNA